MLLFDVPGIVRVFYEEENKLIIREWLEYNPEDKDNVILDILQRSYETFLTYPVKKVMVKADRTKGSFSPRIQRYIREVHIPRLEADTEMRYVVTIQSQDTMNQLASMLWQLQFGDRSKVVLHNVISEEDARSWLQSIDDFKRNDRL